MTVASICLNIGHILLQGTISYISALTTSCQISPVLFFVTQITFESLPPCAFLSPLEEEKMRRRIRQRVCQLTHSDLGVSHGLGKKARPGGTPRGRGESLLPSLHCTTTSRQALGELLHQCASQYDPTQQWVLPLLHQQQLLGPSSSAESGSGPLALTELQ